MSARRGWGEGSVHRRPNGTWAAVLSFGKRTGPDGLERRIRRTVYARTKTEVLAKLQELRLEHPGGVDLGDDLTVAVWVEKWLRDIIPNSVRASTLENYERIVRKLLIPQLGHIPLRRLKPSVIADFYRDLARAGTPASTTRSVHLRLHTALGAACDLELISRNPAARLAKALPKVAESSRRGLDVEQTRRFLEAARGDPALPVVRRRPDDRAAAGRIIRTTLGRCEPRCGSPVGPWHP